MSSIRLLGTLAFVFVGRASFAQTVALDEDFTGAIFPPTNWTEVNNGVSLGWESNGVDRAVHADYFGDNDNRLITRNVDLSTFAQAGLHLDHGQLFATYRELNDVEISLDGGLTFAVLHSVSSIADGPDLKVEIDLASYLGLSGLQFSFHYTGNFANEWSLDRLLVDDQPPIFPPRWPNLPTSFVAADDYCEKFDGLQGVLPAHLAANSVDESTRLPDAEGWCNIGQLAPCVRSFSGTEALEMGLIPGTTNYHQVANALIFGLDGTTATNTAFEMQVYQMGEEVNLDDGLFVSLDGLDWQPVITDWAHMTGGPPNQRTWRRVTADLATAGLNLNGPYYLAIAQADDFPYNSQDGVVIDDFCIGGDVQALHYEVTNLLAGQVANLSVTGADPDSLVSFLYSRNGAGPVDTPYGLADVGQPYYRLATIDANLNGEARMQAQVPPLLNGVTIWTQAIEVLGITGRFTNSLELVVK
jgi:hypothetical protein